MRRRGPVVAAVLAVGLLSACGTRLPDSAFSNQQQVGAGPGTGGSTTTTGKGATGSSGSAGTAGSSGSKGSSGSSGSGSAAGGGTAGKGGAGNTASDTGVTASSITIGEIVSRTNPFDPRAFVGPSYGLQAFVRYTNAHGGIHGRQLKLQTCDDQGNASTDTNCAHTLVDKDKVFALVSNAALNYAGASYVNSKNVPDIGGQPIDNAYNTYRNLFDIYGESYPRNGKVGDNGKLYGGTEVYHFFKRHFPHVALKAGVVEYNQSQSERFGNSIVAGLKAEGYTVETKVVNFALPDFDSVAIDFKNKGVQYVYDTIDRGGNVRLCKALDDNNVTITAKVLTTQSWEQSINSDYKSSPHCRNELWATGNTRNYEDTKYAQVAAFRQQMSADGTGGADDLSDWALEGWAGGLWFSDAASSCGAHLTRVCVEKFMNSGKPYDGHGLLTPREFTSEASEPSTVRNCLNVVRWNSARGAWVDQVADMDKNCAVVKNLSYSAD
jgi:branched-chain amino acid transport system substrate-binding protein